MLHTFCVNIIVSVYLCYSTRDGSWYKPFKDDKHQWLSQKLSDLDEKSADVAKLPAVIAEPLSQASNVATWNTISLHMILFTSNQCC